MKVNGSGNMRDRVSAIGLLVLAGLLVWFGAAEPYLQTLQRSGDKIAEARTQLALYRQIALRQGPDRPVDASGEAMTQLLLPGRSPATASAYLQQEIGVIAETAGAVVLSFEPHRNADSDDTPLAAVGGRVRFSADTEALQAFLHTLESHRPVLTLDNLYVSARANQTGASGANLDVQVDVTGYRPIVAEDGQ